MARRVIDTFWDRNTRNDINNNFEELYDGVENQEKAFNYINSDSLVKPGSISPGQTSFIKNVGKNLFDGRYYNNYTIYTNPIDGDVGYIEHDPSDARVSVLMPLDNNKIYTVTKYAGGNRFNAVLLKELPNPYKTRVNSVANHYIGNTTGRASWTFDNSEHHAVYLLVVVGVGTNEKPNVQLEEGSVSTDYEEPVFEFNGKIKTDADAVIEDESISYRKTDFITHGKNMFDGKFSVNYSILTLNAKDVTYVTGNEESKRKSVVIKLEEGKTYTVTKYPGGNRFNLVTVETPPDAKNTAVASVYSYTGPQDATRHSHTFTNEGANYLILQTNLNNDNLPLVQVEEGNVGTDYEEFVYKFNHPISGVAVGDSETQGVYGPYGYISFNEEDMTTFPGNNDVDTNYVLNLYDELMNEYPDFITKEQFGVSALGEPMFLYNITPDVRDVRESAKEFDQPLPKIVVSTGTHGSEKASVYGAYNFFKFLCRNWEKNDTLAYLRYNAEYILIPFINPDGFNAHTRANANDVDLNRDFPRSIDPNDDYADRETETRATINLMKENMDADFWIDSHVMNIASAIMYSTGRSKVATVTASRVMASVGKMFQKQYSYLPQDDQYKFGYATAGQMNTITDCNNGSGIPAMTMEVVPRLQWQPGNSMNNAAALKLASEYLANTILTRVRQVEIKQIIDLD